MNVLVANIGSTSFKYRLYDMAATTVLAQGRVERIGQPGGDCPNYESAIDRCLTDITGHAVDAVGFKAVFANGVSGAQVVTEEVLKAMEEFSFFAPAHNPPYIAAMRAFRKTAPDLPLVALFETAFFDQVDEAAAAYAVPYSWQQEYGIRRYGFHGASHRAASERVQELLQRSDLRHISCHLGGSASLAAIRNGVAIDCSFGMSPQSGLPHNNRTGDLDTFAVLYMMKRFSLTPDGMARVLATESGLAGISGTSGDARDLEEGAAKGDARCRLAIDVFVRAVRRYIGAFYAELGGLDVLSFTGGIGENSAAIRAQVCGGLEHLGIELNGEANSNAKGEFWIDKAGARVRVLVMPADEERVVARATAAALSGRSRYGNASH